MKRRWWIVVLLIGMVGVAALGVLGWRWFRAPRQPVATRTEAEWLEELASADAEQGARAGSALAEQGEVGLRVLLAARKSSDMRAHRQAVRALARMGSLAARPLVEALPESGERAAVALVRLGPAAVEALEAGLREPESAPHCARVLGEIGPRARAAVPALLALMQDREGSRERRAEVVRALGRIGPDPETPPGLPDPVIDGLTAALDDPAVAVQQRALEALAELGPRAQTALPALARVTRGRNADLAAGACLALAGLGGPGAVAPLVARLKDDRRPVREAAAEGLARLGPVARPALPALADVLSSPTPLAARTALERIGADAVPALAAVLRNDQPAARFQAGLALYHLGSRARPAIRDLQTSLDHPGSTARLAGSALLLASAPWENISTLAALEDLVEQEQDALLVAALALARLDPVQAAPALPRVVRSLRERPGAEMAVDMLAACGPSAHVHADDLVAMLRSGDGLQFQAAAHALYGMGPPIPLAPVIRELLAAELKKTDAVPGRQQALLLLLARLGPAAREALPEIQAALKIPNLRGIAALALARQDAARASEAVQALLLDLEGDRARQAVALMTLRELGSAASEAVQSLRPCLRDPALVRAALDVVEGVGPAGSTLAADLIGLLSERDRLVVQRAGEVLVRLGPAAVPGLRGALKIPNSQVRESAIERLGQIGQPAAAAVPALQAALEDGNSNVRLLAAEALGRIGPAAAPALPTLRTWLSSWEADTRRAAVRALGQMGVDPKEAIPDLVSCLFDPDEVVRYGAASVLGRWASAEEAVLEALEGGLEDASPPVRLASAGALARLESRRLPQAVQTLRALAQGANVSLRREAVEALFTVQPAAARELFPLLEADLRALPDAEAIRLIAALARMDKERIPALLPELVDRLNRPDATKAEAAAVALGQLGQAARPVVSELVRWLPRPGSLAVRRAVTNAIRAIDPAAVPDNVTPGQPLHLYDPWVDR
jgi:HEAT repeat protein